MRPGWLVALFGAIVALSTWLPWLTTSVNGGGWPAPSEAALAAYGYHPDSVPAS
ncbi:putative cONSERVED TRANSMEMBRANE PROTEIN [Mycobacterium xenopi 4042]|uniref:Putative cONSERVED TRANSMEMBRANE PROTEIN n=1 Tax=Mycobacterium xenopi 4042 TaxID=1299334 RepID=X8AG59_MYCXE|nr:putative cONSERVED TRANSMEMBRANE PROTEIN [Mycobacterium xenopi 4042]